MTILIIGNETGSVPDPDPRVFGLTDPDPLVRGMDPDPFIIMQN